MHDQFRLEDLLARDVVPQWFEGVAVVQLVCRQLRAERREASGFPGPGNILIAPGGSVTVAGALDSKPVEAAAHVLGLMLGSDAPVHLRLSISQARANASADLTEFSEALVYFERPDPESIVEAFRQRATMAPRREITPRVQIAASTIEKQSPAPVEKPRRRVSQLALIAAAGVSAFACAAAWMIGNGVPGTLKPRIVMGEGIQSTPATRESATSSAAASAPGRHSEAVSTTSPIVRRGDGALSARATQRKSLTPRLPAPTPELRVVATTISYDYPTVSASEIVTNVPTFVSVAAPLPPGQGTPRNAVGSATSVDSSDRIYSQADLHVTLPLSIYPKFSNDATANPGPGRTTLELTIAANGRVERVRMLTTPRNIHEFMLLSAAKAWRFEPARLGGRPVRFRQLIALTGVR